MADRHMFRASWHDYEGGIFFVTVCTREMRELFGEIRDDRMYLNERGAVCDACVKAIPAHYQDVLIHNYVVMPNHVHILLEITRQPYSANTTEKFGCLRPPEHGEAVEYNHFNAKLSIVIGSFKAAVTRRVRPNARMWQSRYYEHIVRSQHVYNTVNQYIFENPSRWQADRLNLQMLK